eukprot:SAG31_NODE_4721_length_3007_cov_5.646836_1_plen_77_part_00
MTKGVSLKNSPRGILALRNPISRLSVAVISLSPCETGAARLPSDSLIRFCIYGAAVYVRLLPGRRTWTAARICGRY